MSFTISRCMKSAKPLYFLKRMTVRKANHIWYYIKLVLTEELPEKVSGHPPTEVPDHTLRTTILILYK